MATMTLPIRELEHFVFVDAEKARVETQGFARYSREVREVSAASPTTLREISIGRVRRAFEELAETKGRLINAYLETNLSLFPPQVLLSFAETLDEIVSENRELVARARSFDKEIRDSWNAVLERTEDQTEHLESISESLHAASDPECTALLAMAAQPFTRL